jgi:hypothetical protein
MSNQNTNNSFNNISNENLLLITILNTMYNDNYNQIQNLTQSNNQIRNTLTNILYNSRQNNSSTNNTNSSQSVGSSRQPNRYNNINSLFLNTPYIIDNIQEYNIPNTGNMFNNTHNILHTTNASSRISDLSNNLLFSFFQNFFDPIEIYPTQTQIETATRRVRYCDIVTPVNTSCPISLESFNDNDMVTVIRQCGHIFKSEQLNVWFRSNCKCPVCRYDIRSYNTTAQGNSYFNDTNNVNR